MAAVIIICRVLQLISFSALVAINITGQDYNTFQELALLTDDLIDRLCKSIRSLGGLIAALPAVAGGVTGPLGPNPGMDEQG
jgi:hypothetical protein